MSTVMTTTAPKETAAEKEFAMHKAVGWILHNVVWIWLVALILGFGMFNQFFLTVLNMQNITVQATVLGMLGLAVALPLLVAEIDLSIPANLGFSSAIGALAYSELGLPWFIAMLVGVAVATLVGFFNGLCITKLRMVSLIQTLSMMIILQGALLALTHGKTLTNLSDGYVWIGQASIGGWPIMPLIMLIALAFDLCGWRQSARLQFGRHPRRPHQDHHLHAFRLPGWCRRLPAGILADGDHLQSGVQLPALCDCRTDHRWRQRVRRARQCRRHPRRRAAADRHPGRVVDHQCAVVLCRHDRWLHDLHRGGDRCHPGTLFCLTSSPAPANRPSFS